MKHISISNSNGLRAACLALLSLALPAIPASAQGTAITYQGNLTEGGANVTGNKDLTFTLKDALTGGNTVGTPIVKLNHPIANGIFTASLDFGATCFSIGDRWLEIEVDTTTLSPRQRITPSPISLGLPNVCVVNGDVGIGTATPGTPLEVNGTIGATDFTGDGSGLTGLPWVQTPGSSGTEAVDQQMTNWNTGLPMQNSWQSFTAGDTGLLTRIVIHTNGNSGTVNFTLRIYSGEGTGGSQLWNGPITINTSSPSNTARSMLIPVAEAPEVTAGQVYTFHIQGGASWSGLGNSGNPYAGGRNSFFSTYDGYFRTFVTTGILNSTTVAAESGSDVGIGVSSPGAKLHVKQNGVAGIRIEESDPATTFWDIYQHETLNDLTFEYDESGVGSWISSSDGSYNILSDRRRKRDLETLESALEEISRIPVMRYRYKNGGSDEPKTYGYVAQDVEEVFPDLVTERDGIKGLALTEMIPINTRAIQELKEQKDAEIKTRDETIAALEARLARLEAIMKPSSALPDAE